MLFITIEFSFQTPILFDFQSCADLIHYDEWLSYC